jgi:hypothetical protein
MSKNSPNEAAQSTTPLVTPLRGRRLASRKSRLAFKRQSPIGRMAPAMALAS